MRLVLIALSCHRTHVCHTQTMALTIQDSHVANSWLVYTPVDIVRQVCLRAPGRANI